MTERAIPTEKQLVQELFTDLKNVTEKKGVKIPFWNPDLITLASFFDEIPTSFLETAVVLTGSNGQPEIHVVNLVDSVYHGKKRVSITVRQPQKYFQTPAVVLDQEGRLSWPENCPPPCSLQTPQTMLPIIERVANQFKTA